METLSDKAIENTDVGGPKLEDVYWESDVKEFIKKLKENPYITYNDGRQMGKAYFTELLRKLAGEKLI